MKQHAKQMKIALVILAVILAFLFCLFQVHINFRQRGLDSGLVGQVVEDKYPDWAETEEVSQLECTILSKEKLLLSDVYLIKRAGHIQIRFRIAYGIPFLNKDIWSDLHWTIQDSNGNDYTDCMIASEDQQTVLNCVNVTLLMDENRFSLLSQNSLFISAVCTKDAADSQNSSYAHCEAEIFLPVEGR